MLFCNFLVDVPVLIWYMFLACEVWRIAEVSSRLLRRRTKCPCKRTQQVTTCCWGFLANNVASVCMGLKVSPISHYTQQVPTSANIVVVPCKPTQHVGPNNVACCWPTTLRPFAWALTLEASAAHQTSQAKTHHIKKRTNGQLTSKMFCENNIIGN